MGAMTTLHVPVDGWTVDDLPDDVDFGYELVDGALLVTPPARPRHAGAAARLLVRMDAAVSEGERVLLGAGVYFDRRNYRVPDLLVCRGEALQQQHLLAADLLLAVEIMSPGSVANDRIAKPAQYAAAGIPHFWRLELEPAVLVVHALDGGVYRETGRSTDQVALDEPVRLRFRLSELLD